MGVGEVCPLLVLQFALKCSRRLQLFPRSLNSHKYTCQRYDWTREKCTETYNDGTGEKTPWIGAISRVFINRYLRLLVLNSLYSSPCICSIHILFFLSPFSENPTSPLTCWETRMFRYWLSIFSNYIYSRGMEFRYEKNFVCLRIRTCRFCTGLGFSGRTSNIFAHKGIRFARREYL